HRQGAQSPRANRGFPAESPPLRAQISAAAGGSAETALLRVQNISIVYNLPCGVFILPEMFARNARAAPRMQPLKSRRRRDGGTALNGRWGKKRKDGEKR